MGGTSLTNVIAPMHKHMSCRNTRWHILQRRHTTPWSNIFNGQLAMLVYLCFWVDFLKPKTLCKNIALFA